MLDEIETTHSEENQASDVDMTWSGGFGGGGSDALYILLLHIYIYIYIYYIQEVYIHIHMMMMMMFLECFNASVAVSWRLNDDDAFRGVPLVCECSTRV